MPQRITAHCIKDRPVFALIGSPADYKHFRKGNAFFICDRVVLFHGEVDLFIHITLAIKCFVSRKRVQDHKVISPVLQPCQEMCICVDQLGEDCLFGKKLLQRGHQFHDRERGTGADTDRAQSPVVCQHTELAAKYGKSNAQIILRWHVQSGNVVIPGSRNPAHIRDNFDIFDFSLTPDEMSQIALLDKNVRYYNGTPEQIAAFKAWAPDFDTQK